MGRQIRIQGIGVIEYWSYKVIKSRSHKKYRIHLNYFGFGIHQFVNYSG